MNQSIIIYYILLRRLGASFYKTGKLAANMLAFRQKQPKFYDLRYANIIRKRDMFKQRSSEPELMDDLDFKGEVMDRTLQDLKKTNKWLGGDNITLEEVKEVINSNKEMSFSIVDVGCGGGDTLRLLADYGRKNKIRLELKGIDANAYIIDYAKKNTAEYSEISYLQANVFSEDFKKQKFDIISCSLFCHHFEDDELVSLLVQLKKQARLAVVINDLHRHWLAYYSITLLSKLFSKSYMFKYDSRLSVLKAFKKKELVVILEKAGYSRFTIKWEWAFRFKIIAWS